MYGVQGRGRRHLLRGAAALLFERRGHLERTRVALVGLYSTQACRACAAVQIAARGWSHKLGSKQLSFDVAANEGGAPGACYEVVSLDTVVDPVLLEPDAIGPVWQDDRTPHARFFNNKLLGVG